MENPIKMDDLGVPLFLETPISSSVTGFALSSMVFTIRQFCTASFTAWKSESNCRRSARAQALGGCSRSGIAWKMLLNDLKNQVTLPVKDHMASCKNSPWFFLFEIHLHSWLFDCRWLLAVCQTTSGRLAWADAPTAEAPGWQYGC